MGRQSHRQNGLLRIRRAFLIMLLSYGASTTKVAFGFLIQKGFDRSCAVQSITRRNFRTYITTPVPYTTADNIQTPACLPKSCSVWLDINVPQGRCLGVSLEELPESDPDFISPANLANPNHWIHSILHPDEISYGLQSKAQSQAFWMGRVAMHIALGSPPFPILKDAHGRPSLPGGICGSISHKLDRGVALVAPCTNPGRMGIGIDLEVTCRPGKRSTAPRVLTEKERNELGRIPGITPDEEVLLRFRCVGDVSFISFALRY